MWRKLSKIRFNTLTGEIKRYMVDDKKINWYVAHTRVNQELWIKKKLDELGIENFLPQEEQVRETPLGRKTIRVLLIHGMIFIHTDKATSFSVFPVWPEKHTKKVCRPEPAHFYVGITYFRLPRSSTLTLVTAGIAVVSLETVMSPANMAATSAS